MIFTMTNFVPASVTVIILLPIAVLGLFYKKRIIKIEFYLLLLFIYIILSTLIYEPSSFGEFDFYRRDGNFIISYLVLFIFIFLPGYIDFDVEKIFKYIFPLFVLLSAVAYVAVPSETGGVHHFLFESHNAAGGFYSVIAALAAGLCLKERRYLPLFYTIFFSAMLYFTDSRGSLLAIICAVGYSFINFKRPGITLAVFIILQFAIVINTYPDWVSMGKIMSDTAHTTAGVNLSFARASTFIDRLYYLWPRAYDNFIHSPIFGLGFGSYDDLYYQYIDVIPHVFSIKDGAFVRHSEGHAHNSMFNILAELGIVGFGLFILLFNEINKKINEIRSQNIQLGNAIAIAFWTCIFSAATEHRITTPSQMVPFFLVFGMAYLKYCKSKKEMHP